MTFPTIAKSWVDTDLFAQSFDSKTSHLPVQPQVGGLQGCLPPLLVVYDAAEISIKNQLIGGDVSEAGR